MKNKQIKIAICVEDINNSDFCFEGALFKENNNPDVWYKELGKAIECLLDRGANMKMYQKPSEILWAYYNYYKK